MRAIEIVILRLSIIDFIGRWPNWLRFVIWDHESAGSSPVLPTGSNLVVIKTQGVLKGYTGDHYSSHRVEEGISLGDPPTG